MPLTDAEKAEYVIDCAMGPDDSDYEFKVGDQVHAECYALDVIGRIVDIDYEVSYASDALIYRVSWNNGKGGWTYPSELILIPAKNT